MAVRVIRSEQYRKASDLFGYLHQEEMAVFLDSSLENRLGRFSVIGIYPWKILKEEDGICYENEIPVSEPFEQRLQSCMEQIRQDNPTGLPLISGALGYLSYDFGRKYEQIESRHPKKLLIPEALFVFYDLLILEDLEKKELYLSIREEADHAQEKLDRIRRLIADCRPQPVPGRHAGPAEFEPNFEKEDYKAAVDRMISYIIEGDIYIANMTQQLVIESGKDPYEVFRYLRTWNPSPFGGYFQYGAFQIVSASPERFLRIQNGRIETRPIKGTRKRGQTAEEDRMLKQELAQSSKDRSELLMVVDLERNDLNHICEPGSVKVTEHFAVETYATVFHLVTTIVGEVKKKIGIPQLLQAAFPGGSITGTPKIRAMQIIDELEHDRRNLYTGSMGYFSSDGSCDLNIVIRTAVHKDGRYHLGVGGGITCESDLEFEYEETLQKAKAILEALGEDADDSGR